MERFPTNNPGADEMKPSAVRKAQIAGDTEALQRLGQAGARAAARRRNSARAEDEMFDIVSERDRKRDEYERATQANEHIIPPEAYD